jgi:kynurenine formamidase
MFENLTNGKSRFIDLSIGLEASVESEPWPPHIEYEDHADGAETLAAALRKQGFDVTAADFPERMGLAAEEITAVPHTATHMDAPWHYGPEVDGTPSKTIDEVPLSWCAGEAVVLDLTWKEPRTEITVAELQDELDRLDHELSAGEIVLIWTGADELWGDAEYLSKYPGMSAAATDFLVDQGIRVIGIDAYGFDKPFVEMGRRFEETGDSDELWPAHFAGRHVEYCQIEKMANFDELPRQTGIPLVAFPVSIVDGSGGWVRPVATVEAEAEA